MFRIATRRSRRHCSNGCVPSSGMTTRSCLTFTCPFSVCIPLAPQLVFLCLSARMLQESRSFLLVSSFVSIFNILLLFYLFFFFNFCWSNTARRGTQDNRLAVQHVCPFCLVSRPSFFVALVWRTDWNIFKEKPDKKKWGKQVLGVVSVRRYIYFCANSSSMVFFIYDSNIVCLCFFI